MRSFHPLLRGAIELHCHNAPSIFPRVQTDWEFACDLQAAGMTGAVLKSHESSTVERASHIREQFPGLQVFGGLVCNEFTGGLSPAAVDVAIRLGAKCIWMPTISAQAHRDHFRQRPTKLFASDKPISQSPEGLRVWDDDKVILPAVHEILDLIATADIMLATGHLSPAEVRSLVEAAQAHGVRRILIQHADMDIAPIPLALQLELAAKGAVIEKCYLACSSEFNFPIKRLAETIHQLGPEHSVLVTDYGQAHNKPIVEAFSDFIQQLLELGVTEHDIRKMVVENPRYLLHL